MYSETGKCSTIQKVKRKQVRGVERWRLAQSVPSSLVPSRDGLDFGFGFVFSNLRNLEILLVHEVLDRRSAHGQARQVRGCGVGRDVPVRQNRVPRLAARRRRRARARRDEEHRLVHRHGRLHIRRELVLLVGADGKADGRAADRRAELLVVFVARDEQARRQVEAVRLLETRRARAPRAAAAVEEPVHRPQLVLLGHARLDGQAGRSAHGQRRGRHGLVNGCHRGLAGWAEGRHIEAAGAQQVRRDVGHGHLGCTNDRVSTHVVLVDGHARQGVLAGQVHRGTVPCVLAVGLDLVLVAVVDVVLPVGLGQRVGVVVVRVDDIAHRPLRRHEVEAPEGVGRRARWALSSRRLRLRELLQKRQRVALAQRGRVTGHAHARLAHAVARVVHLFLLLRYTGKNIKRSR